MSTDNFSKLFNWVCRSPHLSFFEKILYTRLHGHLGGKLKAWPGMKTLARELSAHPSQVAKGIKRLEELRLIAVIRRRGKDLKMLSNEYTFLQHPMMTEIPVESGDYEDPLFTGEDTPIHPVVVPYSPRGSTPIHLVGAEETQEKRFTEETQRRDSNEGRGSLRSPQVVSLRSSTQTNSFTENQIPFLDEEFTNKSGFAATALAFQPVTVEAVMDEVREEDMSDEEREARKASAARALLMGAQRFDAAKAAKEAKQRAKAKREASSGTPELPKVKPPKQTLFGSLHDLQRTWMLEFQRKFPNDSMEKSWGPKEGAMLKRLLERWGLADLELAMQYYIRYWEQQKVRYPKIKATLPSLGLFVSLDASVVPEAKKMFTALKAKTEYDQWCDANRGATSAPDDLQAAYDAVREDLKALGI